MNYLWKYIDFFTYTFVFVLNLLKDKIGDNWQNE